MYLKLLYSVFDNWPILKMFYRFSRWVCEDFPELRFAFQNIIMKEYDSSWYDLIFVLKELFVYILDTWCVSSIIISGYSKKNLQHHKFKHIGTSYSYFWVPSLLAVVLEVTVTEYK